MIVGELAILLNLLSIMALGVLLIISCGSVWVTIARFKITSSNSSSYSASSRRRMLWLLALSPWLVGLLAASLAILSGTDVFSIFSSGIFDLFHWHHPQEFAFNSWHGLSLGFALSCASFLVIQSVKRLLVNRHQIRWLQSLGKPDENNIYQLDADTPTAFTAGYYQPQCYMTSALRKELTIEEYTIIQLHENAHVRRADPLKKWFFQLLTSFFPLGFSRQLNQAMSLAMEQCADAAVSKLVIDKSKIAATLLKVKRLTVGPFLSVLEEDPTVCYFGSDDSVSNGFGSNNVDSDNLSDRIQYLLSDDKKNTMPILLIISVVIILSLLCAMSADLFHHAIEYSLAH
ncbi:MAG: hypothetical protein COB38_02110 [Gammaproteobacteria bacterium]|nr:MAG: hypothetical protein COB38_02110 [Gammaproteobacteria bacterium]